jgi:hypothetical protein
VRDSEKVSPLIQKLVSLPRSSVSIDAAAVTGPYEWWRHSMGQGFVSAEPLPDKIGDQLAALRPRYMRVSIQEFLAVSPAPERYDWSRIDAYLEAFTRTGAQLIVSFNLKPRWLFPVIDHERWQPSDTEAWRTLIGDVVRRYSVERSWVTHWEVSQEPDIGELGGTPFKIPDARDYWRFYKDFAEVIEDVAPHAKVGGPGVAYGSAAEPLPGFVDLCKEAGTRVDFVSWHLYKNAPERHTQAVSFAKSLLTGLSPTPELIVSEWNKGFSPVNVTEVSSDPGHDAVIAANLLGYFDSGADATFLYHAFDQACNPADFSGWFSSDNAEYLRKAWSDSPWRLGVFSEDGAPNGRYFIYQAVSTLGEDRVRATCSDQLRTLAARTPSMIRLLVVNATIDGGDDTIASLTVSGLPEGRARFSHARLEGSADFRMLESRNIYVADAWTTELFLPRDSVTLVTLEVPE